MSIFGDLTGLGGVATAADGITKSITDLVGRFIPDPNQRMQAENEAKQIIAEGQKAQWNAMSAVMTADAASDSKYTKSARPSVVYWSLGMVTIIATLGLFGLADPVVAALAKVPPDFYDMIKYGVGIYVAGRSTEKVATTAASIVSNVLNRARK